jgi:hypothetical protein
MLLLLQRGGVVLESKDFLIHHLKLLINHKKDRLLIISTNNIEFLNKYPQLMH